MQQLKRIVLAGGCFWGVEEFFSRIPGVLEVRSGYANGFTESPTYREVCSGHTGYAEAVELWYDPQIVTLPLLLEAYFSIIDPTSLNRQGNDVGTQYRTGIFYCDADDEPLIERFLALEAHKYSSPLQVEVEPLKSFYTAEDYHQDYLKKNPGGYCHISFEGVGAIASKILAGNLRTTFEKPNEESLRRQLSPVAYEVTQHAATERPFTGKYLDNHEDGLYVDVVSGEPLFSSRDKFDSHCGWPSFTRPIESGALTAYSDSSHGMQRVEVRSRMADSHLGHVFNDGPQQKGGLRYCINSAALRFIPKTRLSEEGYGRYLPLFES